MKLLLRILSVTLLSLFCASSAQAAFGCDVLPLPKGFIELHEGPDAASSVFFKVPAGVNVSLFDEEQDASGAWVRVAYSTDPDAHWGEGTIGWVLRAQLDYCG